MARSKIQSTIFASCQTGIMHGINKRLHISA